MRALRNEYVGVLAAVASSALGGVAGGTTRFSIGTSDPVTLGVFRFGVGFLLLLPIALALRIKWPRGRDWLAVAALGVMYFAFFIVLFNLAFRYTTAARGSLALSTLPLMTMLVGAAFGVEALDSRKSVGVVIAMAGAAVALISGKVESAKRAPRRGRVTKRQIEQHDEEREIHDAERGDGEPVPTTRPFDPQRECDRQQQQKPDAKSEYAERDRIARADRKPGGAARHAAQRARRDCREHADILVSQSAHGRSGEAA